MAVTYEEGIAINLQDAVRDLNARLHALEALNTKLMPEAVAPTKQVSKTEWTPTSPKV